MSERGHDSAAGSRWDQTSVSLHGVASITATFSAGKALTRLWTLLVPLAEVRLDELAQRQLDFLSRFYLHRFDDRRLRSFGDGDLHPGLEHNRTHTPSPGGGDGVAGGRPGSGIQGQPFRNRPEEQKKDQVDEKRE